MCAAQYMQPQSMLEGESKSAGGCAALCSQCASCLASSQCSTLGGLKHSLRKIDHLVT
jgi:hypothetical protein